MPDLAQEEGARARREEGDQGAPDPGKTVVAAVRHRFVQDVGPPVRRAGHPAPRERQRRGSGSREKSTMKQVKFRSIGRALNPKRMEAEKKHEIVKLTTGINCQLRHVLVRLLLRNRSVGELSLRFCGRLRGQCAFGLAFQKKTRLSLCPAERDETAVLMVEKGQ
mmetsp:Transcript_17913/g.44715  ORF Transcript_17913/g.44715 Transcript_17913/m.44715 type:complete len:165 (-) Transcript_17913:57-551(-)